ncbi:hypothetical protein [Planomonospora venezuelensis]|uniref:Uncharacterized protein n=1 Tax=Planomonospora venezuelensis TaxID=1999 RepID=A0A841DBZ4_PLAVE|nr:hypothetical protein [Planomonospora venezuelensis]MBB5967550.1 hypothetical protein [Planomonospora venezuelensis]GIM62636.1 hypothetical protein Pve01_77700 [Planomonospora venezuelensis]
MDGTRGLALMLLLGGTGVAMLTAGAVMTVRGLRGKEEIRDELIRQKITFPDRGLPAGHGRYAGHRVENGTQARVFSEMIGGNVRKATGGRSYSEVSADLHAAGGDDEGLAVLRQTAFMGETLRASLMSAYQAWQVTSLAVGLGAVLMGAGAALAAAGTILASGQ